MTDGLFLAAAFLLAGFGGGPWWSCAVIALVYGFWRGGKLPRKTLFVLVLAAAGVAWMIPAVLNDVPVGGRVSARIAGIMGVRAGLFSYFAGYLATIALGAVPAILGLSAGIDLRLAIRPPSSPAAEDTPED